MAMARPIVFQANVKLQCGLQDKKNNKRKLVFH